MEKKLKTQSLWDVVMEMVIMKRLQQILSECVNKLDDDKDECVEQFDLVNLWNMEGIVTKQRDLELLVTGFFEKWILFMYHRLQDLRDVMDEGIAVVMLWRKLDLYEIIYLL